MRLHALSLVLAVLAASCGGARADASADHADTTAVTVDVAGFSRYVSDELGFHISYPPEWTVDTDVEQGIVTFTAASAEDGYRNNFNVTVGRLPEGVARAAYYQGEPSRLRNLLGDIQVLEQADVDIDGTAGRGITVIAEQDGVDVGISRLIVLEDSTAWEVTYLTPASRLEREAPRISEIFKSFGFEP